jgi:hypothetical protein
MKFQPKVSPVYALSLLLLFARIKTRADDTLEPSVETEDLEDDTDQLPAAPEYKIPEGVQTLSFNPGNLTDEDQHSQHMPMDLKCDGCRVVAYVVSGFTGLSKMLSSSAVDMQ